MTAPESSDPRWSTYPDTIVEIHASPLVRVDLRRPIAPEVATQLRRLGLGDAWAIVTAHNPGRLLPRQENEVREKALSHVVQALGVPFLPADGVSPDGSQREAGVAIALERGRAVALAGEFGQSAIFWFDGEGFWLVPALVGEAAIGLPVSEA